MKTTNTIYEFYSKDVLDRKVEYIGLDEKANKAFEYIVEAYANELSFTKIIKNMPEKLGYTLHQQSFDLALQMIFDNLSRDDLKKNFINSIRKMDDLDLYEKIEDGNY